jgi:hypothetical protein
VELSEVLLLSFLVHYKFQSHLFLDVTSWSCVHGNVCDCLGWFVKINFTKYVALVNDRALGFKLPLVSVNVLAV